MKSMLTNRTRSQLMQEKAELFSEINVCYRRMNAIHAELELREQDNYIKEAMRIINYPPLRSVK